jgi:spore coat polysaccharide biosynthesis predicted glycosyltransferase SpsG
MKILIRADAGDSIGLGHFYRSVSLAEQLENNNHTVDFICNKTLFWENIVANKFNRNVFFINQENSEINVIKNSNYHYYIIDGNIEYPEEVITNIKMTCKVVMYQNLTNSRFLSDIYILPSIHQNSSFFEGFSSKTKVFKGLQYFTFNNSITRCNTVNICEKVTKIGVITGGSDPNNVLSFLYKLIIQFRIYEIFNDINFTFFYGNNYMHKDQINAHNENHKFKEFDLKYVLNNDIIITAFGVSTYELLALGMPLISLGHQNTTSIASDYLAKKSNSFLSLGYYQDITKEKLKETIEILLDYDLRKTLNQNAVKLLDLHGTERIIKILEEEINEK